MRNDVRHSGGGGVARCRVKQFSSIRIKSDWPIHWFSYWIFTPATALSFGYCLTAEGSDNPDTCIYYPTGFSPVLNYKVTPRGLFIIHNSKERNFVELSASDTMPLLKVELPDYVDVKRRSVLEKYMTSLWNSSIAYQEEPKIAVNVSQLGDLLEIYKQGHDGIISIIGEGGVPDVIRGADRKEMIELVRRGKNVPDGSDQLLVYDLDGTMLRKYKLNRRVNGYRYGQSGAGHGEFEHRSADVYFPASGRVLDRFLSFSDRLKTHIKYGSFVFRTVYRLRSYLRWNTVSRTKPARAKGAPTKAGYWYPNPASSGNPPQ